jgi:hypothetical protein
VGLKRSLLSLVSTIEELLGRKSSCSGPENWYYCRRGLIALTTRHPLSAKVGTSFVDSCGRSVGVVRLRTNVTELLLLLLVVVVVVVVVLVLLHSWVQTWRDVYSFNSNRSSYCTTTAFHCDCIPISPALAAAVWFCILIERVLQSVCLLNLLLSTDLKIRNWNRRKKVMHVKIKM